MSAYIHHKADGSHTHIQCDGDGDHRVYHTFDREPDWAANAPSKRTKPSKQALDAMIDRAIDRTLRTSGASTSRRRAPMPRRSSDLPAAVYNELFQLSPGERGYREPRRSHALDADPGEVMRHLKKALAHVNAVDDGGSEFNAERLRGYLKDAIEALPVEGEDEEEMSEQGKEESLAERIPTERSKVKSDGLLGESSARPVASTRSREIDHRRDFNSIKQGGADAAHGYDSSALFQTGEH